MARLPYPDLATVDVDTLALLEQLPPLNVHLMLADSEGLLDALVRVANHLRFETALDPILREIAIIRVGVLSGARYEVFQHERIARQIGASDELLAAIRGDSDDPIFDDLQRRVVLFTDDVVANVRASRETFMPLVEQLSAREVKELAWTIGFYMAVSRFVESFDVDIEETASEAT